MTALAPTLQGFFTDRLTRQRNASQHTIAGYRDTWRMLLSFATAHTGIVPSLLDLDEIDAPLIAAFLDHLENDRGNSIRTRNTRLAAIHSLFGYAALIHPEHAQSISRVLAIPPKRFDRALICYLTDAEVDALLAACDQTTWTGRRDHTMLLLAVQTGLRISELIDLTQADVHLGPGAHVVCHGKGRKDRATPLTTNTRTVLRDWLGEHIAKPHSADVPQPTRTAPEPRCHRTQDRPLRRPGRPGVRVAARQNGHRPRPTAHHRDATPTCRCRHQRHRALARPRQRRHHPDLPPRRHDPQGASARQNPTTEQQTRPLPTPRHA